VKKADPAWHLLPRGTALPIARWDRRHHLLLALLGGHVLAIPAYALAQGVALLPALAMAAGIGVAAAMGMLWRGSRRFAAGAVTIGLLGASALVVHLSGGVVGSHVHFLLVVVVLTLYQDWVPFGLAAGIVLVHHGVAGVLAPEVVYQQPSAEAAPWLWVGLHGTFTLVTAVTHLAGWRLTEQDQVWSTGALRDAEERFRVAFDSAPIGMALLRGRVTPGGGPPLSTEWLQVNKALCALLGVTAGELLFGGHLVFTHAEDREAEVEDLQGLLDGEIGAYRSERRFIRPDGECVWGLTTGSSVTGPDGHTSYVILQVQDITDRKRAEAILTHRALHDPLTGLANRVLLMDRLAHARAVQLRSGTLLALLFLDLDRFKHVNDTLGHDAGDQMLVEIGERLRSVLRPGDTAARIGGDEFILLCEGIAHADDASALAHRVQEIVAVPVPLDGTEVTVTASIGIAVVDAGTDSPEAILRDADAAMYRAKNRGRARSELFDEALRDEAVDRLHIEGGLKRALADEQITVLYQPTIDLSTQTMEGTEALVRWRHPERGVLAPASFLTVAEDSGLIVPIGLWVLTEACRQAAEWRSVGVDLVVGVNLSARQLNRPGFATVVTRLLEVYELPPGALRLEITESVLVEAAASTVDDLGELRDRGVSLGIDDFGTGYSSMTYLKRFPVDFLKIDKQFVAGLGTDREDTAIVQATLALGGALGLTTIAEGVESAAQAEQLAELGCTLAQGYLYGEPQTPEDVLVAAVPVP
jgi:diguanylate cyclase (GGDEF)-like protein/PAS domain S-box-containing protein